MSSPAPTSITSVAMPLPVDNINTDIIYPARFLLVAERDRVSEYLFHDWRNGANPSGRKTFVFDQKKFAGAKILLAGENFGCGSSREHAVWALLDNGIQCVIAPSFGEIFANNSTENGLVCISLERQYLHVLEEQAKSGREINVSLIDSKIFYGANLTIPFTLPTKIRERLLNGWNECDTILNLYSEDIRRFEQNQEKKQPWLF